MVCISLPILFFLMATAPASARPAGANGGFVVVQEFDAVGRGLELVRLGPGGEPAANLTRSRHDENGPEWSPDGRWIVFETPAGLEVMRPDGSEAKVVLYAQPDWSPTSASWSPDGTQIAYSRIHWDSEGNAAPGTVYILDLATGKSRYLAPTGIINTEIDWSPDGKRLVFQHWRWLVPYQTYGSHVMVVNRDGTGLTDISVLTGGQSSDWRPSFLQDGRIVFRRYSKAGCSVVCPSGFYTVQPDGSDLELLPLPSRDWTGDGRNDSADRLRPSPDGASWAVLVYDNETASHDLWTLDSSFGNPKKLFERIFWFFSWQPKCTLQGTRGNDTLRGTSGPDLICGLGGDDVLYGRGGNDVIFGHGGGDRVLGGDGSDIVVGNEGRDRCDRDEKDFSRVC